MRLSSATNCALTYKKKIGLGSPFNIADPRSVEKRKDEVAGKFIGMIGDESCRLLQDLLIAKLNCQNQVSTCRGQWLCIFMTQYEEYF